MKIRIGNNPWSRNLKASASVSLGIHLLFLLAVSVFISNAKVHRNPILFVKVTLHALENGQKSIPEVTPPLSMKNQGQKPDQDKKDPVQESKQKESLLKNEIVPPIPLPVQAAVKDVPAEEPGGISPPPEEEKIGNEPTNLIRVAALETDSGLKREENLFAPLPSALPGGMQENQPSVTASGEAMGTEQGGSQGSGPGKGPGTAKGGPYWNGSREGTGLGQGGSGGGEAGGGGSGNGSGSGTGSGRGSPLGGVSRKGSGIFAKLFSSSGGAGGAHPRYAENPKPPYPQEAREKGHQGEVLLRVEVLASGRVGQIEVKHSSGHELLDQSALSTVKQWKFIPAQKGETAIPLWVNIPIKFQLQ